MALSSEIDKIFKQIIPTRAKIVSHLINDGNKKYVIRDQSVIYYDILLKILTKGNNGSTTEQDNIK